MKIEFDSEMSARSAHDHALRREAAELRFMKWRILGVIWNCGFLIYFAFGTTTVDNVLVVLFLALALVYSYFTFWAYTNWRFHRWAKGQIEQQVL